MERSLRRPAHTAPAQPGAYRPRAGRLERLPKCRPDLGALERELVRSMLLSFERPSAQPGRAPSSRTLKTAQPCQQTGITARLAGLLSGVVRKRVITVKIGRAHGGCLGTRSR
jgi:hypothetical protein